MIRLVSCLLFTVLIYGCDRLRVFEDFLELPQGWAVTDTLSFQLALDPKDQPFTLTSQFRTDISYPYSNLYYYFQVRDGKDSLLYSQLEEVVFFDSKTGKPLGSGLGDLFHIEDIIMEDFVPISNDTCTVSLIQYMRLDTLRGIDRVGLRVAIQEAD